MSTPCPGIGNGKGRYRSCSFFHFCYLYLALFKSKRYTGMFVICKFELLDMTYIKSCAWKMTACVELHLGDNLLIQLFLPTDLLPPSPHQNPHSSKQNSYIRQKWQHRYLKMGDVRIWAQSESELRNLTRNSSGEKLPLIQTIVMDHFHCGF